MLDKKSWLPHKTWVVLPNRRHAQQNRNHDGRNQRQGHRVTDRLKIQLKIQNEIICPFVGHSNETSTKLTESLCDRFKTTIVC